MSIRMAVAAIAVGATVAGAGFTPARETLVAQEDREAITQAALDYGEGWYAGDVDRMARALHPELAKRMVFTDGAGHSRLNQQSGMTLLEYTRQGGGLEAPVPDKSSEVVILDVFENAAAAKVIGPQWVDYLHLAKWNGRWVIVNVLWEFNPEQAAARRRS